MAKALLIIDYTYDSVADDGALTCGKPAQKLGIVSLNWPINFIGQGIM